ncbi:unknown [Anaerotruncus sp. CAG:390]|nr:unknown [Anaerotruncus sp. CAG:390]
MKGKIGVAAHIFVNNGKDLVVIRHDRAAVGFFRIGADITILINDELIDHPRSALARIIGNVVKRENKRLFALRQHERSYDTAVIAAKQVRVDQNIPLFVERIEQIHEFGGRQAIVAALAVGHGGCEIYLRERYHAVRVDILERFRKHNAFKLGILINAVIFKPLALGGNMAVDAEPDEPLKKPFTVVYPVPDHIFGHGGGDTRLKIAGIPAYHSPGSPARVGIGQSCRLARRLHIFSLCDICQERLKLSRLAARYVGRLRLLSKGVRPSAAEIYGNKHDGGDHRKYRNKSRERSFFHYPHPFHIL